MDLTQHIADLSSKDSSTLTTKTMLNDSYFTNYGLHLLNPESTLNMLLYLNGQGAYFSDGVISHNPVVRLFKHTHPVYLLRILLWSTSLWSSILV